MNKQNSSLLETLTIASFISLVFSPLGLILMWFKCQWKKKTKVIVSTVYALFILIAVVLLTLTMVPPAQARLPGVGPDVTAGSTGIGTIREVPEEVKSLKPADEETNPEKNNSIVPKLKKSEEKKVTSSRWFWFMLFLLAGIIFVVIKNSIGKPAKDFENPYVNTDLYTFPIPEDFKFPVVHYQGLHLKDNEQILFATTCDTKDSKGEMIITNQRIVFNGGGIKTDFPMAMLEAISSISNSAFSLTSGSRTYYFFVHHSQMRYILNIVRWAHNNQ